MKRVAFISHSSKNKAIAETICRFLEVHGISCWIAPRDVMPGKNYGAAIVEAIDGCDVFVLVLSSESNKSGQVVREVERAASTNSVIIPFRIETVQPSRDLEFYVSSSHWLDATEKPLEKHLNALVDAIKNWQSSRTPENAAAEPLPPTRTSRAGLPLIIGGAVVALLLCTLVILLAFRPKPSNPTTPSPAASNAAAPSAAPPSAAATAAPATPSASASPTTMPVIERIIASSQLKPQMYLGVLKTYGAKMAFDGDETTAWVPNSSGPGEWIEVFFKAPTLLTSVSIYGGYGVDFARYSTNNRVRQVRVTFPNGGFRVLSLEDRMQLQRFDLPHRPVVQSVKFEIVSVYRGSKYDSTPISEIAFNRSE